MEDEICNKPTNSKQESSKEPLQNGNYDKGHTISLKRRLINNSRFGRCIFSPKIFKHHCKYLRFSFKGKVLFRSEF